MEKEPRHKHRLRHLRGISLRNLSFDRVIEKQAIDPRAEEESEDDAAPETNRADLPTRSADVFRPATLRRRSTNVATSTPLTRQKVLDIAMSGKAADMFFTLHVPDAEQPLYISETVHKSINFDFQWFEVPSCDHSNRLSMCSIRTWVHRNGNWRLHIEQDLVLAGLRYLSSLDNATLPQNCLVFHMGDGMYTLDLPAEPQSIKRASALPTSSYNTLMRLSNLAGAVDEGLATRKRLECEITAAITGKHSATITRYLAERKEAVKSAQRYCQRAARRLEQRKTRLEKLEESVAARKHAMATERRSQEVALQDLSQLQAQASDTVLLSNIQADIGGQRRRICEELSNVFNITPTNGGKPLSFSIHNLALPNTDYDILRSGEEESISAALGLVTILTDHLQSYLGVPLPYPLHFCGSQSTVRDDISQLLDANHEFPLYIPKGGSAAQFRFDYGWFLLNKNIEALCTAQGLKVVDIRHTLPNLKYLLYVCSAGVKELPERKKGGVRGLWSGRLKGRNLGVSDETASAASSSRRGSFDSDLPSTEARGSQNVRSGGMLSNNNHGEARLSLRTRGLRENVG